MGWSLQAAQNLSAQQFEQWNELLEERTGMHLRRVQQSHLQTQLLMRMRELNCGTFDDYYQTVRVTGAEEWGVFVNRITVNETRFFRHAESFDFLQRTISDKLELLGGSLNVWSVGCASGEEPYSLAMLFEEAIETQSSGISYTIDATDISPKAIALAKLGEYPHSALTDVEPRLREKYFRAQGGVLKVTDAVQRPIRFHCENVLDPARRPVEKMDIIFCQNLLIYFQDWRKNSILDALGEQLKPGGVLIIGPGEVTTWKNALLTPCREKGVQAYRRIQTT